MEPGIDHFPEDNNRDIALFNVSTNAQKTNKAASPPTQTPPEADKSLMGKQRLRTNNAAQESIKAYQSTTDSKKTHTLSTSQFKSWADIIVSERLNLFAKTINSIEKTLLWLIISTRQEEQLELCWSKAKEKFQQLLKDINKQ